ncbi:MAG: Ppx/GppA family phosphatase [Deltaproteobacteria bacterium]|nr:Ppx/GppA family phosphatase [Deltaproteobacteria bacterium]
MSERRIMALDIGTHTVLACVGRARGGRLELLANRQWFARLGEGVRATGRLRPAAIERAVAALREARVLAREQGAEIAAVATRACREAGNTEDFLRPAAEALGTPVEVVSGEREAELTFRGASSGLGVAGPGLWVDVGGGSTELITARDGVVLQAVSTSLGAVALTEAHLGSDPYSAAALAAVRDAVRGVLAGAMVRATPSVVGIGGTATTFAAIATGMSSYDGEKVHGFRLPRERLEEWTARLAAMPAAARGNVEGLAAERAPVIVAGGLVLEEVLARAGAAELIVSDRGVRHGVLLDRLGLHG